MLITLAVVLLVLWALGFLAFGVTSSLIHLLLVIAVIVVVVRLLQGRRVV
ncbi:MAG: lmo0937 family membrane protein [bacterium]